MFDWDAARYFLAAARERSLTRAARALAVKHSTVGRRLDDLEHALGAKLVRRTRDGVALTEVGVAMLPLAETMERAACALERHASVDRQLAGAVQLSAPESFTRFVTASLPALRAAYPEIVVHVRVEDANVSIERGDADLAIRMGPVTGRALLRRPLGAFAWALYATSAYAARHRLPPWPKHDAPDVIGFDRALAHAPGAKWIAANVHADRVVVRCNSLVAALAAATSGVGVAALPCFLAATEPSLVRLTRDAIGTRDGFVVIHPDHKTNRRVRAVADHLCRHASALERA
jgi:DNA-binding transcriptional LysR family regulator